MRKRLGQLGTMNIIGAKVRALRIEKGIKQCQFLVMLQVEGLCISNTSLIRLEWQDRIASVTELVIIAKVLNVDMNDLIDLSQMSLKNQ